RKRGRRTHGFLNHLVHAGGVSPELLVAEGVKPKDSLAGGEIAGRKIVGCGCGSSRSCGGRAVRSRWRCARRECQRETSHESEIGCALDTRPGANRHTASFLSRRCVNVSPSRT